MPQADLLGDDIAATPHAAVYSPPAASAQSNQDLLAEIFGGLSTTAASPPPAAPQRSAVDNIMGLFDNASISSPGLPTPYPTAAPPAAYQAPAPTAPQQKLTAYPAYDKNDVRITLTPQTAAAKPGVVMILARFQVSGGVAATGLSFQAAVPKVHIASLTHARLLIN